VAIFSSDYHLLLFEAGFGAEIKHAKLKFLSIHAQLQKIAEIIKHKR
jgi:hypothetical protein